MRYFIILGALAVSACVEEPVTGQMAFMADCAGCHAADGTGSGADARDLTDQPPDLTTIASRNGGTFPRDQVMCTIDGLDRGAHFSVAMPEFGAGDMGDTVVVETEEGLGTPVPERLLILTDYLESIQR